MVAYDEIAENFCLYEFARCPLRFSKSRNVTIFAFRLGLDVRKTLPWLPFHLLNRVSSSFIVVWVGVGSRRNLILGSLPVPGPFSAQALLLPS
jgi:hypothetical protein